MERLPRRAVILEDGGLAEKQSRNQAENHAVSELCERLRAATGEPRIPRDTTELLQQCLETNDVASWTALKDDVRSGSITPVATPVSAALFLRCILRASDTVHVALIVYSVAGLVCGTDRFSISPGEAVALWRHVAKVLRYVPMHRRETLLECLASAFDTDAARALEEAPDAIEILWKNTLARLPEGLLGIGGWKTIHAVRQFWSLPEVQEHARAHLDSTDVRVLEAACDILARSGHQIPASVGLTLASAFLKVSGGSPVEGTQSSCAPRP